MKEWILEHRKLVTTIIIGIAIVLILITTYLVWRSKGTGTELAEILYYSSQIISAVFVISGVVIAVWQYYVSCVDSKRNIDVIRVQKAIDLSEYYKDNILVYMTPIKYIFENSGLSDIIYKKDISKMKYFDEKELKMLFDDEEVATLKKIQQSEKFFSVVIKASLIYNLGLSEDLVEYYQDNETPRPLSPIDSEVLSTFLDKLITRTLNNMEYFSLHFTHNVADESVVYKSLHQTYIVLVQILYYNIAKKNPLSPRKYYTNVVELYEQWNTKATNDEETFANGVRTLSNKGTVVDDK